MIIETKLAHYSPNIKALHDITKDTLLTSNFLMHKEGKLAMYYSPHNEYINTQPEVIIVGLTPGWQQMKTAYVKLIDSLNHEQSTESILKATKIAASFSGTMRTNLVTMLDELGLSNILGIHSTSELFLTKRSSLHTTSLIKYPVFHDGTNYTGYSPTIDQSNLLKIYAYHVFQKELEHIDCAALIIPLGKAVEKVISKLPNIKHFCLSGFPHPSGANGHRGKQFLHNKQNMRKQLHVWNSNRNV